MTGGGWVWLLVDKFSQRPIVLTFGIIYFFYSPLFYILLLGFGNICYILLLDYWDFRYYDNWDYRQYVMSEELELDCSNSWASALTISTCTCY